jgi:prepilin-type N-terminal cleavage/methylation domain-containing protein
MKRTANGFSLIEVLIAMAVMSLGLLAIATFQTGLLKDSGSNKARSEALAIAQARMDQFRNYTDSATSQDEFDTLFASTANYVTENTINGSNALFTPKYKISGTAGSAKSVEVMVSWSDKDGSVQDITLNSQVGWESPRSVGDLANNNPGTLIPSATGRARLGDGTIDPNAEGVTLQSSNGDGTMTYRDHNDLKLIYGTNADGTMDVVLTLADACKTGTCTNFVTVKGRVYIDTASQGTLQPADIFVKASDAAYCSRYYTVNGTSSNVTSATTKANTPNSASGNYEYFDYTCYLGGGWYGNIGILLTGGLGLTDKICLGDPTSENGWEEPVIAARRAYRGMLYKTDGHGNILRDANNVPIYYSVGVKDGITLPDPDVAGSKTHDFVIASMAASHTAGSYCGDATENPVTAGPLTRADSSSGTLFSGTPADFKCLNGNNNAYIDYSATSPLPSTIYSASQTCPFDPTDGSPVHAYTVSGTVSILAAAGANTALFDNGMKINTSDGPGNCSLTTTFALSNGTYNANYSCDIFDWGSGWTGRIVATYDQANAADPHVVCTPNEIAKTALTGNLSGQNFGNCTAGGKVEIKGAVAPSGNKKLTGAVMDGTNNCTVTQNLNNTTYTCTTVVNNGATWSGSIKFTASGGIICNTHGATTEAQEVTVWYNGAAGRDNAPKPVGTYTQDFTIVNSANACAVVP